MNPVEPEVASAFGKFLLTFVNKGIEFQFPIHFFTKKTFSGFTTHFLEFQTSRFNKTLKGSFSDLLKTIGPLFSDPMAPENIPRPAFRLRPGYRGLLEALFSSPFWLIPLKVKPGEFPPLP